MARNDRDQQDNYDHADKEHKIRIPEAVWEGLEAVRRSGLTNMLDRPRVARLAHDFGYYETADWVSNNRQKYSEGIFRGFEIDREDDDR